MKRGSGEGRKRVEGRKQEDEVRERKEKYREEEEKGIGG